MIPISTLPNDYYVHDEERHRLYGSSTGAVFELGEHVMMTLAEASPITGGLLFHIIGSGEKRPKRPLPPKNAKARGKKKTRRPDARERKRK